MDQSRVVDVDEALDRAQAAIDAAHSDASANVRTGTAGDDRLTSAPAETHLRIEAGDGNDVIQVDHPDALVIAGRGDDRVTIDRGDTDADAVVSTGDGDDILFVNGGNLVAETGAGNDRVAADSPDAFVSTGTGDDEVGIHGGSATIFTGDGNDTVFTIDGETTIIDGAGEDRYFLGQDSVDTIVIGRPDAGLESPPVFQVLLPEPQTPTLTGPMVPSFPLPTGPAMPLTAPETGPQEEASRPGSVIDPAAEIDVISGFDAVRDSFAAARSEAVQRAALVLTDEEIDALLAEGPSDPAFAALLGALASRTSRNDIAVIAFEGPAITVIGPNGLPVPNGVADFAHVSTFVLTDLFVDDRRLSDASAVEANLEAAGFRVLETLEDLGQFRLVDVDGALDRAATDISAALLDLSATVIEGTDRGDRLEIGPRDDGIRVEAGPGNDRITLDHPSVLAITGDGNDRVFVDGGEAIVLTGDGADRLVVRGGEVTAELGAGNDVAVVRGGTAFVSTGTGDDRVVVRDGTATIFTGDGEDTVITRRGETTIVDGAGNDVYQLGRNSIDTIVVGRPEAGLEDQNPGQLPRIEAPDGFESPLIGPVEFDSPLIGPVPSVTDLHVPADIFTTFGQGPVDTTFASTSPFERREPIPFEETFEEERHIEEVIEEELPREPGGEDERLVEPGGEDDDRLIEPGEDDDRPLLDPDDRLERPLDPDAPDVPPTVDLPPVLALAEIDTIVGFDVIRDAFAAASSDGVERAALVLTDEEIDALLAEGQSDPSYVALLEALAAETDGGDIAVIAFERSFLGVVGEDAPFAEGLTQFAQVETFVLEDLFFDGRRFGSEDGVEANLEAAGFRIVEDLEDLVVTVTVPTDVDLI